MTTAHRPTFSSAKGGKHNQKDYAPSLQYSSRDLPAHTALKLRETGQDTPDDLIAKDFKSDLLEREAKAEAKKKRGNVDEDNVASMPGLIGSGVTKAIKMPKLVDEVNLDADDPDTEDDGGDGEDDDDDDDNDDDSDDDTEALMAELERIKQERAEEQRRKAAEAEAEAHERKLQAAMSFNPLLQKDTGFSIKARWDEDTVFQNQARGIDDKGQKKKEFINDTLRSEFHKKFMSKFIK